MLSFRHKLTIHVFDGQTDGFTISNTALHSMQRGKNVLNVYVGLLTDVTEVYDIQKDTSQTCRRTLRDFNRQM